MSQTQQLSEKRVPIQKRYNSDISVESHDGADRPSKKQKGGEAGILKAQAKKRTEDIIQRMKLDKGRCDESAEGSNAKQLIEIQAENNLLKLENDKLKTLLYSGKVYNYSKFNAHSQEYKNLSL